MATSSKEAKVNSILNETILPGSVKKVKYLWQNIDNIRQVSGKIHSCQQKCPRVGTLNFGDMKVWNIPKKKFISQPILKLQVLGTTSTVAPDMFGVACIDKIEIYHNQKILEYSGQNLAQLLMHYAKDDTWKANMYTDLGGNGLTMAATTYTYYIPIFTGFEHPQQIYNKFIEPYYTGLMDNTLDIQITFKSAANSFSTPDTQTAFTLCDLYYTDYYGEPNELGILTTSYKRFIYDIKYINQKYAFVTGTENAINISAVCNDNVEVHDIIWQTVTEANWETAKNYNQGAAPVFFRFNADGNDWYKSSDGNAIDDFTFYYKKKYGRVPQFSATATSYFQLTDPYTHEISDNYSSSLDELIITPGIKLNLKQPLLIIKLTTGNYYLSLCCIRKRVAIYDGNFINFKYS